MANKQKMILVRYVDQHIYFEKEKYNVQLCGYKDKTPMRLEVWRIPCDTPKEAEELRDKIDASRIVFTN